MSSRPVPYDPHYGDKQTQTNPAGGSAFEAIEQVLDETKKAMVGNKVALQQRTDRVQQLNGEADKLQGVAVNFKSAARKSRMQMFMGALKSKLCFIIAAIILVALLIAIPIAVVKH